MDTENLLCRLCASICTNNMITETNNDDYKNLAEKIYQYFVINIDTENDILPRHICTRCYQKVNETSNFHRQIQTAQELLKTKILIKNEYFDEKLNNIKVEDSNHDEPNSFHFLISNGYSDSYSSSDNEPLSERFTEVAKQKGTNNKNSRKKLNTRSKIICMKKLRKNKKEIKLEKKESFFVCHLCGKHYKSNAELKSHLKCHNGEKPFKCDQCPKEYKYYRGLQEHKLSHTDCRPHTCQICGLTFRLKRTLDRHTLVHSDALDYECTFCSKRFKKSYYLKVHLRQHTGERPYSCTDCNHFFANDANFIKHLKGKHGLKQFSIANRHQYPSDFNEILNESKHFLIQCKYSEN